MKYLLFLFLALSTTVSTAQNLVENPHFDELKDTISTEIFKALHNSKSENWFCRLPILQDWESANNYNITIAGHKPHSGGMYPSIEVNGSRGYLQGKLKKQLEAGRVYYLTVYLRSETGAKIESLGVLLSNKNINNHSNDKIEAVPQILINTKQWDKPSEWTPFTYEYKATGGESYIVFGNFLKSKDKGISNVPFSYDIEDVSLRAAEDETASNKH